MSHEQYNNHEQGVHTDKETFGGCLTLKIVLRSSDCVYVYSSTRRIVVILALLLVLLGGVVL